MPNIASALKSEIARVSRKEVRGETESLKKASSQYRSDIAALKRRLGTLETQLRRLAKAAPPSARGTAETPDASRPRFSAKALATHRNKLQLSAQSYGALCGVSGQSIYKWEGGKARPRAAQLQAWSAIRKLGKREAAALLERMSS
jgi:DNA-binding transcriptional regulator YiaG